jgi:hypothetical protein
VKRWVVGATLGLTALSGIVAPATAQAGSAAWYQVYQAGGSSGFFTQVAAISRSNIWAVGDTSTTAGKPIYRPFVRHFNGSSWQAITIPHATDSTADWVSGTAGNVWVGGLKNSPDADDVVYRWNGARWAKIPMPALTALDDVTALSPDNVWALGSSGTVPYDIFHWNGSRWQYYLADTINFIPQALSASGPDDVWVSGIVYRGSKQVVAAYRWNGRAWSRVSMPYRVFNNGGPGVTAVSRSNVWIGWYDTTSEHALHWNGHHWLTVTSSYYEDPINVVPDGEGGYWFGAKEILTGSTWTTEELPGFSGGYGNVIPIPGTTSFLLPAGVETGSSSIERPTIFRFDF